MAKQKYLCVQRSPEDSLGQPSPDELQEMYASFQAWMEKFKTNIVDLGGKLGDGRVITARLVTDGPFIESKEVIGGYMIIAADSMQEAIEVVRESPGSQMPGSSVEIREICTPQ